MWDGENDPPEGDGWIRNTHTGRDGWERFDHHEESYWMRWKGASSNPTGIEAEVCQDIAARQAKGITKYQTTVAENPLSLKEWLQHAYEECLDQAVYLKRAIQELP